MNRLQESTSKIEFGDFQTPPVLARDVCEVLANVGVVPASIVEPTCGTGNLLVAARDRFPEAKTVLGFDINPSHVHVAAARTRDSRTSILQRDFFDTDWNAALANLPEPILVLGNPPWVTSAGLGAIGGANLPAKTNFQNRNGLDAITGKSNFDISEWMLIHLLENLSGKDATLAMLCKTAVARKVLAHAWKHKFPISRARIYGIDAPRHFGANVDAGLLLCRLSCKNEELNCQTYKTLSANVPLSTIGYRDGQLVADVRAYSRWKHLQGRDTYKWRSGVKHDCAKVMELRREGNRYRNGLGCLVELDDEFVFPMMKSSDLAKRPLGTPRRWMLVTQKKIGDDTNVIKDRAEATWNYLQQNAALLDRRGSSIYKNRARFSMFGVGPYTFAPWKIAISGFYKTLSFQLVGALDGKPIVLDDTAYFIASQKQDEATYLASLLNSPTAREFFEAFIFWDAKRPITVELLRRLDLRLLACELGTGSTIDRYLVDQPAYHRGKNDSDVLQGNLFAG